MESAERKNIYGIQNNCKVAGGIVGIESARGKSYIWNLKF